MPRNSSGTYTLPPGNPVVTATTISSTWANTTLSDIGTSITDSLSRTGDGGMLAALELVAGVVGAPGLSWTAEPTSGLYRNGAGDFRYSIAAVDVLTITTSAFTIAGNLNVNGISPNTFLGDITINSANPQYYWNQITATADNREWDIVATAEALRGRLLNDAHSIVTSWFEVERTTTTVDSVYFPSSPVYFQNGTAVAPAIAFGTDTNTGLFRSAADQIGITTNGATVATIYSGGIVLDLGVYASTVGAVGAPSYSFVGDLNSGMFLPVADQPSIVAGGVLIGTFFSGGLSLNTGQFRAPDGLVGTPSITFVNDLDTGIYRSAANELAFSTGGVLRGAFFSGGFAVQDGTNAAPSVTFVTDPDTGLYRVGADQLGITTGGVLRLTTSTTAFTGTLPWQGQNGAVGAPAWSFSGDTNTGFYQTTADQIAIALGGTTAGEISQGSFTGTLVGCTTSPTVSVFYQRVGKLVHLWVTGAVSGTSNSVAFSMTGLPVAIRPTSGVQTLVTASGFRDNTNGPYIGAVFLTNTDTLIFAMSTVSGAKVTADASGWTGSGTKGLDNSWSCTYSIT